MPECACWPSPSETRVQHGDAVERGSALEANPECREHSPVSGLVALASIPEKVSEGAPLTVVVRTMFSVEPAPRFEAVACAPKPYP